MDIKCTGFYMVLNHAEVEGFVLVVQMLLGSEIRSATMLVLFVRV